MIFFSWERTGHSPKLILLSPPTSTPRSRQVFKKFMKNLCIGLASPFITLVLAHHARNPGCATVLYDDNNCRTNTWKWIMFTTIWGEFSIGFPYCLPFCEHWSSIGIYSSAFDVSLNLDVAWHLWMWGCPTWPIFWISWRFFRKKSAVNVDTLLDFEILASTLIFIFQGKVEK